MGKLQILLGAGVGYVLGARAGRERYDQIEQQARKLWSNPKVQDAAGQAEDAARQAGAQARDKVQDAVGSVTSNDTPTDDATRPGDALATPNDMPSTTGGTRSHD